MKKAALEQSVCNYQIALAILSVVYLSSLQKTLGNLAAAYTEQTSFASQITNQTKH